MLKMTPSLGAILISLLQSYINQI